MAAKFEFSGRRAITESAVNYKAAAGRYNSHESDDDEEINKSGEFFDLNQLPDQTP